jgi:23S rRNA (cytosine1962-C5)-methyltransferase
MEPKVRLKPGREKPVLNGHPWVFSGAIGGVEGEPRDGDLVSVIDSRGNYLATGYLNRRSQIAVRVLAWDQAERIDRDFWTRRLRRAIAGRSRLEANPEITAFRLVHSEADGLPGLVVDRYGDWLVVQCLTLGMALRKEMIADLLAEPSTHSSREDWTPAGIYARDDARIRRKEGLTLETGLLRGGEPPELVEIIEHGHRFLADLQRGHKTGFYLDQRENRLKAANYCAGAEVLNGFAYTGGFGVYAGAAGAAAVENIDSSVDVLALAEKNLALNGCEPQELIAGDLFQMLRDYRDQGRSFDVVILDPPKFASSKAQVMDASRGYKDLNLVSMQLLQRGGTLITFSCSGLISEDLFQKIVFGASVDARRDVQILERLTQGSDHPVLLTFPESAYLKGLICRVW